MCGCKWRLKVVIEAASVENSQHANRLPNGVLPATTSKPLHRSARVTTMTWPYLQSKKFHQRWAHNLQSRAHRRTSLPTWKHCASRPACVAKHCSRPYLGCILGATLLQCLNPPPSTCSTTQQLRLRIDLPSPKVTANSSSTSSMQWRKQGVCAKGANGGLLIQTRFLGDKGTGGEGEGVWVGRHPTGAAPSFLLT